MASLDPQLFTNGWMTQTFKSLHPSVQSLCNGMMRKGEEGGGHKWFMIVQAHS